MTTLTNLKTDVAAVNAAHDALQKDGAATGVTAKTLNADASKLKAALPTLTKDLAAYTPVVATFVESPDKTTFSGAVGQIVDAKGGVWTLVASQPAGAGLGIAMNDLYVTFSANVTSLTYSNRTVTQGNAAGGFWTQTYTGTPPVFTAIVGPDVRTTVTPPVQSPPASGQFVGKAGVIYDPSGAVWRAHGINVAGWAATGPGGPGQGGNGTANGTFLMQMFPNCNMVRLNCGRENPGTFDAFVNNLTAAKIYVVFEDHITNNSIPSGGELNNQLSWYVNNYNHNKGLPGAAYIGYGTTNEPNTWSNGGYDCAVNQKAIYDALRGAGYGGMIGLGLNADVSTLAAQKAFYAPMRNTYWDQHAYADGTQSNEAAVKAQFAAYGKTAQTNNGCVNQDGIMPVIWGEYGTSINGETATYDGTWMVNAVQQSKDFNGAVVWCWSAGTADRVQLNGNITALGRAALAFQAGNPPTSWADSDNS